jgi:glycosyltransferase involved in cell wall biosynthesis
LLESIEALKDNSVECFVLVPAHGDLSQELRERQIPFDVIPYGMWMTRSGTPFWARLKSAIRILGTTIPVALRIRQWKIDVVYSNTSTVCVGAFAALLLRRPHVWHLHEFGYEDHGLVFLFGRSLPYKVMNYLSSGWIANSGAIQKKYGRSLDLSKSKVIYYSMHHRPEDATSLNPLESAMAARNGKFRCIIVGTLFERKGQEDALLAIAELAKRQITTELLIVGKGDPIYYQRLLNIVTTHCLENHVVFTGHVDDPFPLFRSADVALVCSRAEAFGRVTIEAMLAGKPVIASKAGANEELIREGFNGMLYNAADPTELADKIAFLYENRSLAERLGHNGRQWAEETFTKERYSHEVLSFLMSLNGSAATRTDRDLRF